MTIAVIQGYLSKRAMKSGKNWKKRYFILDNEGYLSYSEKKGSPVKKKIPITPNSQINALKEMGGDAGISITGPHHEPLYLRADSAEVADGWIRALNIMKHGGSSTQMKQGQQARGATLREAYAKKNALGGSGRTLERKKKNNTLERKGGGSKTDPKTFEMTARPISFSPDLIPPPPPPDEDELAVERSYQQDDEEEDDDDAGVGRGYDSAGSEKAGKGTFSDGYMMRIGTRDYFVDSAGWEYYDSREAFLQGKKPLGRAVLSMVV